MTPTIGRIVWCRVPEGIDIPAIITHVNDEQHVYVTPFAPPWIEVSNFLATHPVPYSEKPEPDTWRWPEIVR